MFFQSFLAQISRIWFGAGGVTTPNLASFGVLETIVWRFFISVEMDSSSQMTEREFDECSSRHRCVGHICLPEVLTKAWFPCRRGRIPLLYKSMQSRGKGAERGRVGNGCLRSLRGAFDVTTWPRTTFPELTSFAHLNEDRLLSRTRGVFDLRCSTLTARRQNFAPHNKLWRDSFAHHTSEA